MSQQVSEVQEPRALLAAFSLYGLGHPAGPI